jgi:hypothetical protein
MKGDEGGESWSWSTTEMLKDTEKEEREMCMPPSVVTKHTSTIRKDTVVSHLTQSQRIHGGPPRVQTPPLHLRRRRHRPRVWALRRCGRATTLFSSSDLPFELPLPRHSDLKISRLGIDGHWDTCDASPSEHICELCSPTALRDVTNAFGGFSTASARALEET